jgi:methionyl-tRNA formyltransferase
MQVCKERQIITHFQKSLKNLKSEIEEVDKIFVLGWQYLIHKHHEKLIIFHDSYLPERRGFSPTVSALLDRSAYLGATSFKPYKDACEPDYGKIYSRKKEPIKYPISLESAFSLVSRMYVQMFNEIIDTNKDPYDIDYNISTFSLWRDNEDMVIDWNKSSEDILIKIMALGYPYDGAISYFEEQEVRVIEAIQIPDIVICNRQDNVGKILRLKNGNPIVVCGNGLLLLNNVQNKNGFTMEFKNIRRRFK